MTKQEFIKECVVEHTAPLFEKMTDDELLEWQKRWNKERDEAYLSFDLKKIKEFVTKNREIMGVPYIPTDRVLYSSAMKAIFCLRRASDEQKKKAADWLIENGFRPGIR